MSSDTPIFDLLGELAATQGRLQACEEIIARVRAYGVVAPTGKDHPRHWSAFRAGAEGQRAAMVAALGPEPPP